MLENLEGAGLVNGEVLTIEVWHLIKNELHHIRCINRSLLLMDGPMKLTLGEVYDINLKPLAIHTGIVNIIILAEKIDQPTMNNI